MAGITLGQATTIVDTALWKARETGSLVLLSGVTAASVYHHHLHREEDFDLPPTMYLGGHLPTTTTVEVSRLATRPRCKREVAAIAVTDGDGAR